MIRILLQFRSEIMRYNLGYTYSDRWTTTGLNRCRWCSVTCIAASSAPKFTSQLAARESSVRSALAIRCRPHSRKRASDTRSILSSGIYTTISLASISITIVIPKSVIEFFADRIELQLGWRSRSANWTLGEPQTGENLPDGLERGQGRKSLQSCLRPMFHD
jgi:hypothetical protein